MSEIDELSLRQQAVRRADAKLAFRRHFISYVIINAGLVVINLLTSRDYFWAVWPMLGWGIGLLAHWASVYIDDGDVRDRAIEREMEKLRRRL